MQSASNRTLCARSCARRFVCLHSAKKVKAKAVCTAKLPRMQFAIGSHREKWWCASLVRCCFVRADMLDGCAAMCVCARRYLYMHGNRMAMLQCVFMCMFRYKNNVAGHEKWRHDKRCASFIITSAYNVCTNVLARLARIENSIFLPYFWMERERLAIVTGRPTIPFSIRFVWAKNVCIAHVWLLLSLLVGWLAGWPAVCTHILDVDQSWEKRDGTRAKSQRTPCDHHHHLRADISFYMCNLCVYIWFYLCFLGV